MVKAVVLPWIAARNESCPLFAPVAIAGLLGYSLAVILLAMARKKIQWHPLFTRLLRPLVERYYEIRTGVPVGDLPRQADLVLLRRTRTGPTPFQGLWRHLTAWNVLEFKGPSADPRPAHLPLLMELGLGIARRLQEEGGRIIPEPEISFWYLANRLGRKFGVEAERLLNGWRVISAGLWRADILGHPVYLASTVDLPVDEDSLPLHVLALQPQVRERQVGEYVAATEERFETYGGVFSVLHQGVWREVEAMARRGRRTLTLDIRPAVETLGLAEVIRQIGKEEVIRQIGKGEVIRQIGKETIVANLPAAKRRELKRLLADE